MQVGGVFQGESILAMKPPPFRYHRPADLSEALYYLNKYGPKARILAGGQSLVPEMNFRKVCPDVLIDINAIKSLKNIEVGARGWIFGAGLTQSALAHSEAMHEACPIMKNVLNYVGYEQTRNRGTFGGSLAYGDPAGELPAMAIALNAEFELKAHDRSRWVPAESFYTGPFSTVVKSDEMLTRIRIPLRKEPVFWAFAEQPVKTFGKAIAGVAVCLALDSGYKISAARIVAWGVGDRPLRLKGVEDVLTENILTDATVASAVSKVRDEIDPPADVHASSQFRTHLAETLLRRSLNPNDAP